MKTKLLKIFRIKNKMLLITVFPFILLLLLLIIPFSFYIIVTLGANESHIENILIKAFIFILYYIILFFTFQKIFNM